MGQIASLLNNLSLRQKVTIGFAAVAAIMVITGLARWNRERDFKPLYSGLANEDAGAVVGRLKETGIEYRVSDGGASILVPSAKVAEVRLQMAAAGLPRSGRIGFELFDKTSFGATDFAEQVNYHRALEGELERSIMSLAEVERARVHVTFAKDSLFLEQRQPAKASVMVRLRPGARLSPQNVLAVTHLVASAVEGLTPETVSLVDMNGTLLNRPRRTGAADTLHGSDSALEYRQQIEKDLIAKIGTTLEPVLGSEKFRTGVSVECDFSSGEQSEESFDPSRSVMVTSQKTEDISAGPATAGVPGTASNLPRPPARSSSGYGTTRRTENISYQSSRVVRRVTLPQGGVKRISVAVLVDYAVRWQGMGNNARRVVEPPSPERLKVIRELVAATAGLHAERGDQLIVESLPFETTLTPGRMSDAPAPAVQPSRVYLPLGIPFAGNAAVVAGVAAGAALSLLALVALWWMRRRRRASRVQATEARKSIEGRPDAADSLEKQLEEKYAAQAAQRELQAQEVLNSLKLPTVKTKKTEVLTRQLAEETKKDPQSMAHVVRTWLQEEK
ncbi:MAG TPA: flagellar basal-body MS-ring/collar protein FliF [Bryobacteraceae bacterium]|nr:flagellar basal-body MS-ring/collar protein FliF [Bryobacteraceae bacterium]